MNTETKPTPDIPAQIEEVLAAAEKRIRAYKNKRKKIEVLHDTANLLIERNYPDVALPYIERLLAATEQGFPKERAWGILLMGFYYMARGVYDAALSNAKTALAHAEAADAKEVAVTATHIVGTVEMYIGNYSGALHWLERALEMGEQYAPKRIARMYTEMGIVHDIIGDSARAIEFFNKAYNEAERDGDILRQAGLLNNIALGYASLGDDIGALERFNQSLDTFEKAGEARLTEQVLSNLGTLYKALGDSGGAEEYYRRALHIAEQTEGFAAVASSYNNLATLATDAGNYETAAERLARGMEYALQSGSKSTEELLLNNQAYLYTLTEDYAAAEALYHKLIPLSEQSGDTRGLVTILCGYALMLRHTGRYAESATALERAAGLAAELSMMPELQRIHADAAETYQYLGDVGQAFAHLKKLFELEKRLMPPERTARLQKLMVEQEVRRAVEKMSELDQLNQSLRGELERKNVELQELALKMAQKKELFEAVKEEIAELSEQQLSESDASRLIHILEAGQTDRDWQGFEQHFSLLHPHFTAQLTACCPKLSAIEIRVCTLMKMHLSNQQIADILYLSKRTVDTHRYNIRKKLGLLPHENINELLNSL